MAGLNKVESFLIDLDVSYEEPQPGTWLVDDPQKGLPRIMITVADPVVFFHAKVMALPSKDREAFYEELLKLNYKGLLHGAYAIDGGEVILMDTLEYEGMDKDEFEASLDAIGFSLNEHYPLLSKYMDK